VTESLIDLKALLVEREDFEGGMVGRLREGLAQGGPQVRNLKDIIDTLTKRMAVAAPPQQKKIHLKLGVANYFLGHARSAVEHLHKAEARSPRSSSGRRTSRSGSRASTRKTSPTRPTTTTRR
jgi:DNA-directed RNA polymerase subunit alpha